MNRRVDYLEHSPCHSLIATRTPLYWSILSLRDWPNLDTIIDLTSRKNFPYDNSWWDIFNEIIYRADFSGNAHAQTLQILEVIVQSRADTSYKCKTCREVHFQNTSSILYILCFPQESLADCWLNESNK